MRNQGLNIDLFEQIFEEKTLKKGLALFKKLEPAAVEKRAGGEFIFIFDSNENTILHVKKKANKVISNKCSCKKNDCEHLCAALFYLSREKLLFLNTRSKGKSQNGIETYFELLSKKLKGLKKKNGEGDNSFKLIGLFEEQNKQADKVSLNLAIINDFSEKYFYSKNLNNDTEKNILHAAIDNCLKYFKKGLNETQKEILLLTVKKILSNNRKFNSGALSYLLPFALKDQKDTKEFKELRSLLNKRKLKYNFPQYLNAQKIASYQLSLREDELLGSDKTKTGDVNAELSVARANLSLAQNKTKTAFKELVSDHQKIQKSIPNNYNNYVDFIIDKAKLCEQEKIEKDLLKTNILYDSLVSLEKLDRLNALMQKKEKEEFLKILVNKFKKQPDLYFEKMTVILESEKKYDELIAEINKYNNKYFLINRIAMKKLPAYDDFTFKVYAKQFDNILYEARESFHQKEIFERLKLYLDKLPPKASAKLIQMLIEKVSRNNFIYAALKKYSEIFLECGTNLPVEK